MDEDYVWDKTWIGKGFEERVHAVQNYETRAGVGKAMVVGHHDVY